MVIVLPLCEIAVFANSDFLAIRVSHCFSSSDFLFHPVNRLDKGTTGLMVVAKSGHVHDLLRRSLHTPDFRREYRAVCLGRPQPEEGTIDAPIGRDETSTVARKIRPDGAAAVAIQPRIL